MKEKIQRNARGQQRRQQPMEEAASQTTRHNEQRDVDKGRWRSEKGMLAENPCSSANGKSERGEREIESTNHSPRSVCHATGEMVKA